MEQIIHVIKLSASSFVGQNLRQTRSLVQIDERFHKKSRHIYQDHNIIDKRKNIMHVIYTLEPSLLTTLHRETRKIY